MKKALKIIVLLIIAPLFTYWGYCWFANTNSIQGVIHKDANAVVRIGVHHIKKTLLLNALGNPGYYFKHISSSSSKKKKDSTVEKGIDLQPYNFTFFSLPTSKNTFYSVLSIVDDVAFKAQVKDIAVAQGSSINVDEENNIYWLQLKNYGVISWNKTKVVAALGINLSYKANRQVFVDILVLNKVIEEKEHKWIKAISNNKDHVFYISDKASLSLNFKDGKALLSGNIITKTESTYPKEVAVPKIENSAAFLYSDANFSVFENKRNFVKEWEKFSVLKKNNINISEISNQINGFFYLGVNGTTVQKDTVISYSYDDNFNKVEQKIAQEKEVPKIELQLGTVKNGLVPYLKSKDLVSSKQLFTVLPYYQFYVSETNTLAVFKTEKTVSNYAEVKSPYFMKLHVDFAKTIEQLSIVKAADYFKTLETLTVTGQQKTTKNVHIRGELLGVLPDINLLSQLVLENKTN